MDVKDYFLGSEKFMFKNFHPNCYPIDYDFIFLNKAFYFPYFDKYYIPQSKDKKYNFSGISGYALANYNRFIKSGDLKYKEVFLNQIKFIEHNNNEGSYSSFQSFDDINPPWYSSLYQGLIASCYVRAYLLTNKFKYILLAKDSIEFVLNYEGNQMLVKKIKNINISQEYPGNKVPNVLNGHLSFLIGALETNKYLSLNNEVKIDITNFMINLKKFLSLCSKNKWSLYNYNPVKSMYNYSTINYHNLHISQIKYISTLTNSSEFDVIIKNWLLGKKSLIIRLYAMIQKIKYKFLNEY